MLFDLCVKATFVFVSCMVWPTGRSTLNKQKCKQTCTVVIHAHEHVSECHGYVGLYINRLHMSTGTGQTLIFLLCLEGRRPLLCCVSCMQIVLFLSENVPTLEDMTDLQLYTDTCRLTYVIYISNTPHTISSGKSKIFQLAQICDRKHKSNVQGDVPLVNFSPAASPLQLYCQHVSTKV